MVALLLALTLTCYPLISFEPTTLTVTARVPPEAENRWLRVIADGEQYFRSTLIQLAGDLEKVTHRVEWRDVPAGEYEVVAEVWGASKIRERRTMRVIVKSRF